MTFSDFTKHRIISHILFWLAYLVYFSIQYGYTRSDYLVAFLQQGMFLPFIMTAVYLNIYFLIPNYLLNKKYQRFFTYFILSAFALVLLMRFSTKYLTPYLLFSPEVQARFAEISFFNPLYILSHIFTIYSVVFIAAFIKLVKQWYGEQQRHQKLVQEKLEAELKYLKAQINPHVLFNLLNTIYGLSLTGSKQTPEMILKLSSILNYMLYECDSELIPLDKELDMLRDYITLEKLRYGERLTISFDIKGNTSGVSIAPLILLPFVENSFKHGVGKETEESWINIIINVDARNLSFTIENNKSEDAGNTTINNEGIGLKNVKRQLELLYKKRFNLEFRDEKKTFLVKLSIQHNDIPNEN